MRKIGTVFTLMAGLAFGIGAQAKMMCNPAAPAPGCPGYVGPLSHLGQKGGLAGPATPAPVSTALGPHSVVPWMGNSPTTIAHQMPIVLLWEAQNNPGTANQMIAMGPYLFATFTNDYIRQGGNVPAFLAGIAQYATAQQLLYIRQGFGAATDTAVNAAAPAAVSASYRASAKGASLATSHSQLIDKGLVSLIGGFLPAEYSMTQNELWWMYFTQGTGTTIAQATVKMIWFEANVLFSTAVFSYKAGGYIVTFLDSVNPQINIAIGNLVGATVDWTVDLVESNPTGSSFVDLPVDANGNWVFPVDGFFNPIDTTLDPWEDCVFLGC